VNEFFAEIVALLRDVSGEDAEWMAGIQPATTLDGDLMLESVELTALSAALQRRYGPGVDLAGYVAGLDIDQIIGLTVADVAEYVAAHGIRVGEVVG
jgi:acyl carrier protein